MQHSGLFCSMARLWPGLPTYLGTLTELNINTLRSHITGFLSQAQSARQIWRGYINHCMEWTWDHDNKGDWKKPFNGNEILNHCSRTWIGRKWPLKSVALQSRGQRSTLTVVARCVGSGRLGRFLAAGRSGDKFLQDTVRVGFMSFQPLYSRRKSGIMDETGVETNLDPLSSLRVVMVNSWLMLISCIEKPVGVFRISTWGC